MRTRAEVFGAWVRVDDATLIAVNQRAARRLGIEGGALWEVGEEAGRPAAEQDALVEAVRGIPAPLEVHLAVTARCGAGCSGCYLDATPDGAVPAFEVLAERLRAIAEAGAFTVAFGGGEPLSRSDLGALGRLARELGLTPVVTTSGIGMSRARAEELRAFAQVNVSYDGEREAYAAVRGFDGAAVAERAMKMLREAGVAFGVNVVLTRQSVDVLERTLARAAALGAVEAQLLRYKPAGRAQHAGYLEARLTEAQVAGLGPRIERLVVEGVGAPAVSMGIRIDCALVPLLSGGALDPERLARFGVLGCEAGRHLAAVGVGGAVAPCSFAPSSQAVAEEAWGRGGAGVGEATLASWRRRMAAEPCASCALQEVCRGGCRVVAMHLTGALGPDPECPRVQAFQRGERGSAAQRSAPVGRRLEVLR
ncbi:radical SAM/SPASM domain-containing protein [Chondromyces apiculatus]|uniref:Radical SAM domain protein n=1 Tax=Chondromyces apiculatus DSM 436 TaxID=1192034 RepID=A0A017T9Y2_9BACT|nr:radical SAM protein [Chondromyces apiculatus]EYF05625.1 Radical SAM domain protein [Chondromyces apiculatus DSM 436]